MLYRVEFFCLMLLVERERINIGQNYSWKTGHAIVVSTARIPRQLITPCKQVT